MNFHEAEAYLYSLGNEVLAMKLGLDATRELLRALGDPQNKYLKVQIAGTNGKGSVCAFLDSICNTAGIKTGTFTSPHLVSITERVRINGADISEGEFARHATTVRNTSERLVSEGTLDIVPTFFEQITAIALLAFADGGVDLGILETGLGGRLDATTAANAEIAVITRIDLDHREYLGDTIEEIAAEKAGIIHQGSRVMMVGQPDAAMLPILDRCAALGIEPKITSPYSRGERLGLLGSHQSENAGIAVGVVELLRDSFSISDEDVELGLRNARHPGRLEYQGRYLFDGAHNPGGARALAAYLKQFESRPITLVFGAMQGKDVAEMAEILFPLSQQLILTRPDNSRAMTVDDLPSISERKTIKTQNVAEAIRVAENITLSDGLILVTGSLYLVGEVKKYLKFEI